jgi:hypothetical protein
MIFKEGELSRDSVYAKFAYTAADGNKMAMNINYTKKYKK